MTQAVLQFETDLSRGRRNPQSQAAHARLMPHRPNMRQRCYDFIESQGSYGATLAELCTCLNKLPHQLSGRLTELRAQGRIVLNGMVRNDHAVYVTAAHGGK